MRDLLPEIYARVGEAVSIGQYAQKPSSYHKTERDMRVELFLWQTKHRDAWLAGEAPFYIAALSSWLYWLGMVETPLPQNIEREIREWAGQREQLILRPLTRLIEFPSHEACEEALHAGLQGTRVGELFVRVAQGVKVIDVLNTIYGQQPYPIIDYAQPPQHSLEAREDGMLLPRSESGDLLLPGQLAQWAEQLDNKRWRITPAKLEAMRKAGVTAKAFLAALESRVLFGIPPLLELAIRHALGGKNAAIQGDTAFVLHIKDKKLYMAIVTSELLTPYLLDIPGPDTIVVNSKKLKEFKEHLKWLSITLDPYAPAIDRPDWLQVMRDASSGERHRHWR